MQADKAGYVYPVVSEDKCVDCGLCEKVCPTLRFESIKDTYDLECFAAWNKDEEIRRLSTSGGVFSVIAENFINNNGYVAGVRLSDSNKTEHVILDSSESLYQLRKAKYVQSDLGNIFQEVKTLLESDNKVLFSGTPCQISGLKAFLQKEYSNLFTVDIICHGVANQKVFDSYIKSLENTKGTALKSFDFRNKYSGWERYSTKAVFDNGEELFTGKNDDMFLKGYLDYSLYVRPSCTDCLFKGSNRCSDITLGDFWGVKNILPEDDDKGVSAVIVNTEKGKSLFESAKQNLTVRSVDIDHIVSGNPSLIKSTQTGPYSEYFFRRFEKTDFSELMQKIAEKTLWARKDLSFKERVYILINKLKNQ